MREEWPAGSGGQVGPEASAGGFDPRGALPAARGPVRLLAASGAGREGHADRGRHSLSAVATDGGAGTAQERMADRGRSATPLLRAERGGREGFREAVQQLA